MGVAAQNQAGQKGSKVFIQLTEVIGKHFHWKFPSHFLLKNKDTSAANYMNIF